jgi:hypothetical protein
MERKQDRQENSKTPGYATQGKKQFDPYFHSSIHPIESMDLLPPTQSPISFFMNSKGTFTFVAALNN